jgi:hypothetical protein
MNTTDPAGFDDWYRQEHLPMLSKTPTWKRTLRYKAGPKADLASSEQPGYLAMYFFEDLAKASASPEAAAANETEMTKKYLAESQPPAVARAWKLIGRERWEGPKL